MIVVCGEALVDLLSTGGDTYVARPGGSPANVAVGLTRLQVRTAFLGRLACDGFGADLRGHLEANGVDLALAVAAAEPTTLAVASVDLGGQASYTFYVTGTADWQWTEDELPDPLPGEVRALHTGSLALALPPGRVVLTDLLRRERARGRVVLSYDPNLRPALEPDMEAARRRVAEQVGLCHLVKASREDIALLHPDTDALDVARTWLADGPSIVVVTDGGAGATAVTNAGTTYCPSPPVEVVDTVGAGDAFTAGLLAWLDRSGALGSGPAGLGAVDVAAMLRYAADVAALTCTRAGADPPDPAALAAFRNS